MAKTVTVLGTKYQILRGSKDKYPILEDADGYCDFTNKTIVIENDLEHYQQADMDVWYEKVLAHEITHAFMYESGLDICSEFGRNETLIDWIAIQVGKINEAIETALGR